jgi:hypothetical protein
MSNWNPNVYGAQRTAYHLSPAWRVPSRSRGFSRYLTGSKLARFRASLELRKSKSKVDCYMKPAGNDPTSSPRPAAPSDAKKSYSAPEIKVYGDVRDLTGSGGPSGVHDSPLVPPHSHPHFS